MSARRPWLLLLALALCALATRARGADDPPRGGPFGFDHLFHEGRVDARNVALPECVHCHTLDKSKNPSRAPGHAACFSAGCHGAVAPPTTDVEKRICMSCHDRADPGKGAHGLPAPEDSRDYGLAFAHDRHVAPSQADGGAGCERCHTAPKDGPRPALRARNAAHAHDRCLACHGATVAAAPAPADPAAPPPPFAITDCARCHRDVAGRFIAPALRPSAYAPTFSHDRHLGRAAGTPGQRCLPCHADIETAGGMDLPAPSMARCEACHDGAKAFSTVVPTCTRCHTRGDALPSPAPRQLFDHGKHAARGVALTCATCHSLDAAGAPRPASSDHMPCASAPCHADDFHSPAPVTCGGCHVGTEPWRPLRADVARRRRSEFGVEYSHAAHLAGDRPRSLAACADCHVGLVGGPAMRLGRAHASCGGDGCHGGAATPAPALADCTGCHQQGLLPGLDQRRQQSRWSVAARFVHEPHSTDASGGALPCTDCHTGVLRARRVAEIAPPAQATCAGCHDGVLAFKMTGHACTRCHGHQ